MFLVPIAKFSGVLATFLIYWIDPAFSAIQDNVPVCPTKSANEKGQNYPYVVFGNSPAHCYVASRQGPCSRGSVLFAKPRSHLGVCSCACFLSDGIEFDDEAVANYRYCFDSRNGCTYAYDKARGECYKLGSRGPCPPGEIFVDNGIMDYQSTPKCVREDVSNETHTPIESERCPPGTIYSSLLNICTDMSFHGLKSTTPSPTSRPPGGKCPPGTIYSTLLNICTDMNFHGLKSTTPSPTSRPPGGKCPPGTIYSTLLNICTDMNFHGLKSTTPSPTSRPPGGKCPPGTIYSTLLNICTDMSFHGLKSTTPSPTSRPPGGKCPPGTIYSTLLNICTDMNFRGLGWGSNRL